MQHAFLHLDVDSGWMACLPSPFLLFYAICLPLLLPAFVLVHLIYWFTKLSLAFSVWFSKGFSVFLWPPLF